MGLEDCLRGGLGIGVMAEISTRFVCEEEGLEVNISGISPGEIDVKGVCVGRYMVEGKSVEGDGIEEDIGHG